MSSNSEFTTKGGELLGPTSRPFPHPTLRLPSANPNGEVLGPLSLTGNSVANCVNTRGTIVETPSGGCWDYEPSSGKSEIIVPLPPFSFTGSVYCEQIDCKHFVNPK